MAPSTVAIRFTVLVGCVAGFLMGCSTSDSPKLYSVSGRVTYEGEPVKEGRILFRPADDPHGRPYETAITGGAYKLKVEPGPMAVEITATRIIPGKFNNVNGTPEPAGEMYIPAKYNSATTLTATVEPRSNDISFDLRK